jgi:hypothetical protein
MDRTVVLKFDTRVLVVIGALLVMLAAWLPWTSLPSFVAGDLARRGVDGGGLITFSLALLALLSLLLPWHPLRRVSLAAAILAALINLVALIAFARVIQLSDSLGFHLSAQLGSVNSGLALTFAGLVLMLFGGLAEATSPSPFARQILDMVNPRQMEVALRVALGGLLVASCLCAWGVGLLVRPYTLVSPGQAQGAAVFKPAPTTFLATPLVDVHLAPLGPVGGAPTTVAAPTRANIASPAAPTFAPGSAASTLSPTTPPPASVTLPASPTLQVQPTHSPTPTRTTGPTPTRTTTPTLTSTPLSSPLKTPTASPTNLTATATITATPTP